MIDPPYGDRRLVHFWQIVVRGMQPEETLRVEGLEHRAVMTARPTRAGVAHLALMFAGDEAPAELSLELSGGQRADKEPGREMEISMQQVLFEHRATLRVRGPLRGKRFEGSNRARRLVLEDAEHDMLWDVRASFAPTLLRSTARSEREGERCGGHVLNNRKRLGAAPSQNLRRALERLRDQFGPLAAVGSPRVGGFAETLYVRTKQGARLIDISNLEEPREVQVFERPAWYEGVALGGALMARHDPTAGVVELYSATVRHRV